MPPAGVFLVPARKTRKNRLGAASLPAASGGRREGVACAAVGREQARFVGRSYRRVPQTGSAELIFPQGKPPPQDPSRRAFIDSACKVSALFTIFQVTVSLQAPQVRGDLLPKNKNHRCEQQRWLFLQKGKKRGRKEDSERMLLRLSAPFLLIGYKSDLNNC